jgi:uncharacterized membrane protein YhiD involved in acid resistance
MEGALSFRDIFKKSFLESGQVLQAVNPETLMKAAGYIILSLVVGLLLFGLYRKTYAGVVYSHTFAMSLVGMTVLTCAIILTIQSNMVLSLGMVGALSIVRFRTAIKDQMDLLYLFWAVASGISVGAGMIVIALFVLIVMALTLLIMKRRRGPRDEMYILLVHYSGQGMEEKIRRALGTCPYKIKSKTLRKRDVEMAVEVRVRRGRTGFVDALRYTEGIDDVTLVQYSGDYID